MNPGHQKIIEAAEGLARRCGEVLSEPGIQQSLRLLARGVLETLDPPQPETVQEVTKPNVTQPEVAKPNVAEPGVAKPNVIKPGVAEPGVAEPGVAEPGVAEPGVTKPLAIPIGDIDTQIVSPGGEPSRSTPRASSAEPVIPASVAVGMLSLGGSNESPDQTAQSVRRESARKLEKLENLDDSGESDELSLIIERCRIKAEAAHWAAERQHLLREGVDFETGIEPKTRDIITRARQLPDCFLWMIHSSGPTPPDLAMYEQLAEYYEMLAHVLELSATAITHSAVGNHELESAMNLVAETQSALRQVIERIGGNYDFDQIAAHKWLCRETDIRRIHLHRYMRSDDPADPDRGDQLAGRIETLDGVIGRGVEGQRHQRKLLGKVRYEAKRIRQSPAQFLEHSPKLIAATVDLIASGVPPSHVGLRECWLPIHHRFDEVEDLPPEVLLVLREVECHLARHPSDEDRSVSPSGDSAEVLELRNLLRGKSMMMIGGDRRPLRQKAIAGAFELRELIWDSADAHTSLDQFLPAIRRDDVAVVLLSIRWSSHSYSDLDAVCRQHDKLFVRLPAGNNANQIAHQVLLQVGERLRQAIV